MADDGEIAFALAEARVAQGLARVAAALPSGVRGECDECGEQMPRLIGGRCGFCRDGRRPPLSFYDRADAPVAPEPTKEEQVPMPNTEPATQGRKITIEGDALKAVEQRAEATGAYLKDAAAELIMLGDAAEKADAYIKAPPALATKTIQVERITTPPLKRLAECEGAQQNETDGAAETAIDDDKVYSIAGFALSELLDEIARRAEAAVPPGLFEDQVARANAAEAKLAPLKSLLG